MLLDVSNAPYVFLRAEVESDVSAEDQFQALFDRGQPFVLVTNHGEDDHQNETSEERKEKALFFKKIRERMSKLCRGMIVLEGDKPTPGPARLKAATASKALGFKVVFASNENDAIRQGTELLTEDK